MESTLEELEDAELMARVRAGQAEPLALLFDRHHGPVYGFLFRMTGHRAAAEDLVQEVFLRVLRYAASFKPDAPFRPWLYRIARNTLADHASRHRTEVSLEPHAFTLCSEDPSAHAHLEAAQDQDRLTRALARLPRDKRELLLLSRDPDLGYGELAKTLGCSPGALKVRVHRALQELRAHFFEGHSMEGGTACSPELARRPSPPSQAVSTQSPDATSAMTAETFAEVP